MDILNLIITEADRRALLSMISKLKEAIYKTDDSVKEILSKNAVFQEPLLALLPSSVEKMEDKSELESTLEKLEEQAKEIKSISLTLAIPLTDRIIGLLTNWAKANFAEKIIFDITLDQNIVGGAIFIINGKYMDFSLGKKLDGAFETKEPELRALIQ